MLTIQSDPIPEFCRKNRLTAREGGKEIGRLHIFILHEESVLRQFAYIGGVHVSEGHRGKGVALELMRSAIEYARREQCYKIVLTARYANAAAHRLYDKLGFTHQGHERRLNLE